MTRILKWIGLGAAGLLVAAILVGAACEQVARVNASRKFGAPGRMVSVDGRDIQIDCRGQGSPTVVFESGLDVFGSLSWAAVHDSVAMTTRACAYSRAGIMWSGQPTGSFTSSGVARDLRMALTAAKEAGPFVMVAHSLGGPYVMTFTGLYPEDVAGVVLVDASHPDQVARLEKATGTSMTPPTGMLAFGSAMARTGLIRMLVGDLAPAPAPPLVHEATAAFAPTSLSAVLGEARAVQSSFQSAGQYRNLGDRPLIVLTAMAELSGGTSPECGVSATGVA